MPQMPTSLEIERAMNLLRGFGWDKKKEEVTETEITLTIVKKREVEIKPSPT
jgi:hypothetical protein